MKYILIHPDDNVAVALQPLQKGEDITCGGHEIRILEDIPAGHKVAVKTIRQGENVIKYGFPIGHVTQEAMPGQWINEHVLKTNLQGITDYRYQPVAIPGTDAGKPRTFKGYVRKNGDVGIRNELWIIPTVGCVNGVAQELARRMNEETRTKDIDGITAYTHNYGCSQLGEDHENTRRILRDMALHPNAGGVLIVGLGCENNQPEDFMASLGDYDKQRIRLLV